MARLRQGFGGMYLKSKARACILAWGLGTFDRLIERNPRYKEKWIWWSWGNAYVHNKKDENHILNMNWWQSCIRNDWYWYRRTNKVSGVALLLSLSNLVGELVSRNGGHFATITCSSISLQSLIIILVAIQFRTFVTFVSFTTESYLLQSYLSITEWT